MEEDFVNTKYSRFELLSYLFIPQQIQKAQLYLFSLGLYSSSRHLK